MTRSRSNSLDNSCFIKLSNCGSATEQDIRSFFDGIEIESVGPNENGSVLVKCTNCKGSAACLAFDMKSLNGSQVTVRRDAGADSGPKEQGALRL